METGLTILVAVFLVAVSFIPYFIRHRARERKVREKFLKIAGSESNVAMSLHPKIDLLKCIGCGSCVKACPEDVLGLMEGKVVLIHAAKCVGHGLCAEECPVGAIELVLGSPGRNANLPLIDQNYETNVKGIYIVGELGGIGLIKNAVMQGTKAVEHVAAQVRSSNWHLDVAIVGAGPGGLAAALNAKRYGLKYLCFEQGDIGGTILQYPRQKIVMTSPVDLPLYGKLKLTETRKEHLLEVWNNIIDRTQLDIHTNEKVISIEKQDDTFHIRTVKSEYKTKAIVLALGRQGTPRKLGVPGEHLSKVLYRLIDAESYRDSNILVVGGGDSAIEAAIGLAAQRGNHVTLSYRKSEFTRIKERNLKHLNACVSGKKIEVLLNSVVREIEPHTVSLDVKKELIKIKNDFIFIFAGGELPYDFLKQIGIQFHSESL